MGFALGIYIICLVYLLIQMGSSRKTTMKIEVFIFVQKEINTMIYINITI